MPFIAKVPELSRRIFIFLLALTAVVGVGTQTAHAIPQVLLKIGDTTATNGQLNSVVSVFIQNSVDTIAGFKIYLQLDNPDIMKFQGDSATVIDTTYWDCTATSGGHCIESTLTTPSGSWDFRHIDTSNVLIGNFDTTGTLVKGWQYITSRSLAGNGYDLLLVGLADDPFVAGTKPGIAPRGSAGLLLKLLADAKSICDTTITGDDRKTNIIIQTSFVGNFGLSKPNGTAIGISYQHYLDTNYYVCNQWAGSVCIGGWDRTSTPPYDSIEVHPDSLPYVDSSKVLIDNGSLTLLPGSCYKCGDINNDVQHKITITDLTYLVAYLFNGGPAIPPPTARANVNCVGSGLGITITDLTYFVAFLFNGGPAPCANCPQ